MLMAKRGPKGPRKKYIWMLVTQDKYELPCCVFDSCEELADYCGVSKDSVRSAVFHFEKEGRKFSRYRRVEV